MFCLRERRLSGRIFKTKGQLLEQFSMGLNRNGFSYAQHNKAV